MRKNLKFLRRPAALLPAGASLLALFAAPQPAAAQPNILMITVDDLKPLLGCYGDPLAKTPHIDRLAAKGTVFLNAHCQQAVCGPSRMSFFTGLRPDSTKVWDLQTNLREVCPDAVTMQQYFMQNGYASLGCGKVMHGSKNGDPQSWSAPFMEDDMMKYAEGYPVPAVEEYQAPAIHAAVKEMEKQNIKNWQQRRRWLEKQGAMPATECLDVPDDAYSGGAMTTWAIQQIEAHSKAKKPLFLTVGYHRPHLPFVAPKKYWDMYDRAAFKPAPVQTMPVGAPDYAGHSWGELRNYSDVEIPQSGPVPPEKHPELIHGYYASVSYTDAQIGRLLDALEANGELANTVIVLWGDHGWHLGDHGMWCKHTNYEQATRAPLLIAAPGMASAATRAMAEMVDVYPTICELAGLPVPEFLEGDSLVPVLQDPSATVKDYSISQYPRGNRMGYALRDERYRLVLWLRDDYRSNRPFDPALIDAIELYDYETDPLETVNLATRPEYKEVVQQLQAQMADFFKQYEQ